MSDLNQAIREHLALKRLHGADPGEVANLEREVFGEFSPEPVAEFATAHEPEIRADFDRFAPVEELVVPTNEYAQASVRPYMEVGEETQEYTIEDRVGWTVGPAWQGGAA